MNNNSPQRPELWAASGARAASRPSARLPRVGARGCPGVGARAAALASALARLPWRRRRVERRARFTAGALAAGAIRRPRHFTTVGQSALVTGRAPRLLVVMVTAFRIGMHGMLRAGLTRMKTKLSKKQKKKLNKLGRKVLKPVAAVTSIAAVFAAGLYSGAARSYLSSAGSAVTRKVKGLASSLGVSKLANGVSGRARPEVELVQSS
ncbi:hypothetical protein [Sorangium sp. So ce1335]|uniref:hypothetical protein n=1 Tax=Sorangium sp. So ce1335 TaxID=3133335 RepID=UPI003F610649